VPTTIRSDLRRGARLPALLVALALMFFSGNSVAWQPYWYLQPWTSNPYDIDANEAAFASVFGFNTQKTKTTIRSAFFAWQNLGIAVPPVRFDSTTGYESTVTAATCCNGDCVTASACVGKLMPYINTERWDMVVYRNPQHEPYGDHGDGAVDIQSVLTHEFGHALGLAHEDNPAVQTVMRTSYQGGIGVYPLRFPMDDDHNGSRAMQGGAALVVAARNMGDVSTTALTSFSQGSPAVASMRAGTSPRWHLGAWINYETDSKVQYRTWQSLSNLGPVCQPGEWTLDGVSASLDVDQASFALAFRSDDDSCHLRIMRGITGSLTGCNAARGTDVFYDASIKYTRRRPTLAFDPGSAKLILVWIDNVTGRLRSRVTSSLTMGWSPENTHGNAEWTDAPVGVACGYWTPDNGYACFLAFPTSDGDHWLRICQARVDPTKGLEIMSCANYGPWLGNVGPAIRVEGNGNTLRVLYSGLDDVRNLYYFTRTCTSPTNCTTGGAWGGGQSPTSPSMSSFSELETFVQP
jgi:hypothetical protein